MGTRTISAINLLSKAWENFVQLTVSVLAVNGYSTGH